MWDVAGDEYGRQNQIARMRLLPGCSESTILGVFVGKPTTESSLHSHYGSDSGCNIPISHVIPTNWPVRISLRVGLFTTAYRCGPEVCFGEVTWTGCRLGAEMKCGREFAASHPRMGRFPSRWISSELSVIRVLAVC